MIPEAISKRTGKAITDSGGKILKERLDESRYITDQLLNVKEFDEFNHGYIDPVTKKVVVKSGPQNKIGRYTKIDDDVIDNIESKAIVSFRFGDPHYSEKVAKEYLDGLNKFANDCLNNDPNLSPNGAIKYNIKITSEYLNNRSNLAEKIANAISSVKNKNYKPDTSDVLNISNSIMLQYNRIYSIKTLDTIKRNTKRYVDELAKVLNSGKLNDLDNIAIAELKQIIRCNALHEIIYSGKIKYNVDQPFSDYLEEATKEIVKLLEGKLNHNIDLDNLYKLYKLNKTDNYEFGGLVEGIRALNKKVAASTKPTPIATPAPAPKPKPEVIPPSKTNPSEKKHTPMYNNRPVNTGPNNLALSPRLNNAIDNIGNIAGKMAGNRDVEKSNDLVKYIMATAAIVGTATTGLYFATRDRK